MLQALLHKKIRTAENCDAIARQEDVITSLAFGLLELLPHDSGIGAWLSTLGLPKTASAKLDFWPGGDSKTEPDMLIKTPQFSALVEAKNGAEFGHLQLGREWNWLHAQCDAPFYLIVITRIPITVDAIHAQCVQDLNALGPKYAPPTHDQIRTTTWSTLGQVARRLPDQPHHIARLRDNLIDGLTMAGVVRPPFEGWPTPALRLEADPKWYRHV